MAELIADSHCHILDSRLKHKSDEIVRSLRGDGLEFIVEVTSDPEECREVLDFAKKHKDVYCTCGVHPIYAIQYNSEFEKWAEEHIRKNSIRNGGKIVAVGEIGLDYHEHDLFKLPPYSESKMPLSELQKQVFIKQIKLANRAGLPIAVHTREAFEGTVEVLRGCKNELKNGVLIHCFSYGAEEVRQLSREFDVYFAFGGAITYKNAATAEAAIRAVPLDRLMLETDAPYLSPVPFRGKENEPKNAHVVCEHVARILNLTSEEVGKITLENTRRFYGIR